MPPIQGDCLLYCYSLIFFQINIVGTVIVTAPAATVTEPTAPAAAEEISVEDLELILHGPALHAATEAQTIFANKIANYAFERTGKTVRPDLSSKANCRTWIDKMISKGYKPPYNKN